ncbi:hypothetical protein SAMN05428945_2482 [Streptomyces sp. 2224.1]|uniref:hypothetical protein n=1 Tax=Streptomyces sp. 2224.1 TaxID=1881020 RepID=UPI0008948723|nr:hypothetical protein [Streptomyces sp. 2224.1]SEC27772.1 hypothetical protein SAMN05428945_2482 [Streptomyces sp. 2224.1]
MSQLSRISRRALALASAGLLSVGLGTVAATEASAAPRADVVIIDGYTRTVRESAGTPVECPAYQVLIGRAHSGDENGNTTYYCGFILIHDELVQVSGPTWSSSQRESGSFFSAPPPNKALSGRQHSGDENGQTRYATASLTWQGRNVHLTSYRWTAGQRESSSHSKAGPEEVMVGRQHNGDENGQTYYQYARVTLG